MKKTSIKKRYTQKRKRKFNKRKNNNTNKNKTHKIKNKLSGGDNDINIQNGVGVDKKSWDPNKISPAFFGYKLNSKYII